MTLSIIWKLKVIHDLSRAQAVNLGVVYDGRIVMLLITRTIWLMESDVL